MAGLIFYICMYTHTRTYEHTDTHIHRHTDSRRETAHKHTDTHTHAIKRHTSKCITTPKHNTDIERAYILIKTYNCMH